MTHTSPALPLASLVGSPRERWNRLCRASRGGPPRGAASAREASPPGDNERGGYTFLCSSRSSIDGCPARTSRSATASASCAATRTQIREAVRRAVDGRGIRDLEQGEDVHIPKRDLSQPVFGHGQGGKREAVHPGNSEYVTGDRIKRPDGGGGGGSGSGQASDSGEGEDDFVFHLTKEEFMQAFFDDLALPNLTRTQLAEIPEYKSHRAGFVNDGTPSNLSIVRSMRGALGRRIALSADSRQRAARGIEAALALLEEQGVQRRGLAQAEGRPASSASSSAEEPHRARTLPRSAGPEVPQPRAGAGAVHARRHVLRDGRVGLDGRVAQGSRQALLHPAVPVPDSALRQDRGRLHPPPHAGGRGRRAELLPRHRDGRHGGLQRAGADGRDHPRALSQPTSGTSTARRPATATTGTTTAAAAASC